jgi:hypothetical protein
MHAVVPCSVACLAVYARCHRCADCYKLRGVHTRVVLVQQETAAERLKQAKAAAAIAANEAEQRLLDEQEKVTTHYTYIHISHVLAAVEAVILLSCAAGQQAP